MNNTSHSHQNSPIAAVPNNPPTSNGTPTSDISSQQPAGPKAFSSELNVSEQQQIQQQIQHQQQRFHRDGPATISLPPGTLIRPETHDPSAMYGIYQQHGAGYIQPAYGGQMTTTGQYPTAYYNANSTAQYYSTSGYAVPQALLMQQSHQQHHQYTQMMGQGHQGIHQAMISTSGPVQQQQQIGATSAVGHLQQASVVVTSSAGPTPIIQPQQQPQKKERKILTFVNPESGEALQLGNESKPPPSTTPIAGAGGAAADEDNKSALLKTEFMKKVSERVKDSESPRQHISRSSPSFTEPSESMDTKHVEFEAKTEIVEYHYSDSSMPGGMTQPISIEHPNPPQIIHHSPHNLPSILEIKVTQPSPQKEEERPFLGIPVSVQNKEQHIQLQRDDEERKNHLSDVVNQDLNGSGGDTQSPTPTEEGEILLSEEKLRELDEEMEAFEQIKDENNDTDSQIYGRSFLMFLRKVTHAFKAVKCPKTEEELEELGISKRGAMPVSQFTTGKTKRFDVGSDQFKLSWQQHGGGGGGGGQFGGGNRFGTTRPPYTGRHSDNKMKPKKAPMMGRPSLDQRPLKLAQINQQPEMPKKSANAWKSKREERFDMTAPMKDDEDAKFEKLKKEVRGLLNKITPSTYEELTADFCNYKIHEDSKLMTVIIDLIFDKAVEEPHFCPLYSDLCKKQVDFERQNLAQRDKTPTLEAQQQPKPKEKNFRNEIILKCQRTFLASDDYDNKIKELEEKIKDLDTSDEKGRSQIEEEIETRRSKEKRRLLGIIRFIGQLYRHQLLIESIIDWCAVELIKRYEVTKDEVYIEYAVELVETVGKIYEERKNYVLQQISSRQSGRTTAQVASADTKQPEYRLDMVFSHLSQLKNSVSNRVRFAILDLEDLRKNHWMPRGGEKGPKTIVEVREQVEKEQHENELERIEHEKQKDKLQPMRRSSGRPGYLGRSSTDRRAAATTNSLFPRGDSKTESRISSMSKLSDLDSAMTLGRKTWKDRDRTPQKEGSTGDAWRTTKSGTDSPKETGDS